MLDRIANPPPGMLRRGSPVLIGTKRGVIHRLGSGGTYADVTESFAFEQGGRKVVEVSVHESPVSALALDLTDPTGRVHLAWWLSHGDEARFGAMIESMPEGLDAYDKAFSGEDMTLQEIDLLVRLALRVAGRAV